MRRVRRLLAFAVVASLVVGGLVIAFRGQLMRLAGVSFDIGTPGQTSLQLPAGMHAGVFAQGLAAPRFMAVSPDGVLFVAERDADRIEALPDRDADGTADETIVVGSGYGQAHSLAFVDATTTLYRVTLGPDLRERARTVLYGDYPGDGAHTTRTVLIRDDGQILLSVGSSCNVCEEADDRRAAILAIPPAGGTARVLMRGLRNAVGLTADPATGTVWATDMGRDLLGDDIPPETLYRVEDGADAGWPRCHAGTLVDPDLGQRPSPFDGKVGSGRARGDVPGAFGAARARVLGRAGGDRVPRLVEPVEQGRLRGRLVPVVGRSRRRPGAAGQRLP